MESPLILSAGDMSPSCGVLSMTSNVVSWFGVSTERLTVSAVGVGGLSVFNMTGTNGLGVDALWAVLAELTIGDF